MKKARECEWVCERETVLEEPLVRLCKELKLGTHRDRKRNEKLLCCKPGGVRQIDERKRRRGRGTKMEPRK